MRAINPSTFPIIKDLKHNTFIPVVTDNKFYKIPADLLFEVYSYEAILSKSDMNNLDTIPFVITATDLGLVEGQGAKLEFSLEYRSDDDGIPFDIAGGRDITMYNSLNDGILVIAEATIESNVLWNITSLNNHRVDTSYNFISSGAITGGGNNATVRMKIFYKKITL